jgi:hypothetical protein
MARRRSFSQAFGQRHNCAPSRIRPPEPLLFLLASGILATWSADGNLGAAPCSTLHNVYCFQVP